MFQNPRVVIPGVSPELFALILRFMYLGEVNCPQKYLNDVLVLSKYLKIK